VQRILPISPPPMMGQYLWGRLIVLGLKLLRRVPWIR
jgi:hypothetical protein